MRNANAQSHPSRPAAGDASTPPDHAQFSVWTSERGGILAHAGENDASSPHTRAVEVAAPELIDTLAGPGAILPQKNLFYGTDMGISYQHQGKLFMLFGDSWLTATGLCNTTPPDHDDMLATVPLTYSGSIPELTFVTDPAAPNAPGWVEVYRGKTSLSMGWGRTPLAAFSDGKHAFGVFGRAEQSVCETDPASPSSAPKCRFDPDFGCSVTTGVCAPPLSVVSPDLCNAATQNCSISACVLQSPGFCIDETSSLATTFPTQSDSERFAVTDNIEIALQRASSPQIYDSSFVFSTSKFRNPTARSVHKLSGHLGGNDYRPGPGALLMWGRPAWWGEQGQQASLYLLTQQLPLDVDGSGQIRFAPQYFAGVKPNSGEPIWSSHQIDAKALALDGMVDGDPHEELTVVNQMTISWLDTPIRKWVMIYGGDQSAEVLVDPTAAEWPRAPGALAMRFADQPWGPWSPPEPHLLTGDPNTVGDNFGPGGQLFHYACVDKPPAHCAQTDSLRPLEVFIPGCPTPPVQTDVGHFYSPYIIDEYTTPNGTDGLDIIWDVSTWNPYDVTLMKTTIRSRD